MKLAWKFAFDFGWFKGIDFALFKFYFVEVGEGLTTILSIQIFKFVIGIYITKE